MKSFSKWFRIWKLIWLHLLFAQSCVINNDPAYTKWTGGRIPFYLTPSDYSNDERNLILQAMQTIMSNTGGCIQFQLLNSPPTPGTMNYVIISKNGGPGTPSPTCFSYPGMIAGQLGLQGQHMSIQGGNSGCMGSVKAVMRMLASLIGLRSEHNKPNNRAQFIQINPSNVESRVQPYVPLNQYDPSRVCFDPDFDYNSITLIDPNQFSGNGAPVIQSLGRPLLNTGQLSRKDCQGIALYYRDQSGSCNANNCPDPYNAGGLTQMPQCGAQSSQIGLQSTNLIGQQPTIGGQFQPVIGGQIPGINPTNPQQPINNFIPQQPFNPQQPINTFPSNIQPSVNVNNGPQTPNLVPPIGAQNPTIPVQPINTIPINNNPFNNIPNNNIPNNNFPNNNFPNNNFPNNNIPNNNFPNNFPNNNIPNNNPLNNNIPNVPFNPTNNNNLFPNDPLNFPGNNNNNILQPNNPNIPFNNNIPSNIVPNNPSNPFNNNFPNNNIPNSGFSNPGDFGRK
ncbi:AAC-rich mRNA clone AAC11 protein-like [Paramacrobiotus metropolitanus]|uniref:AAC-rich mRNA clone AAC11 protein-like n=1 Tax=Paramacrobiotus metropolitanus TaxID=2943436 RepID=UPI00244654DE|nr:AAC-rich mRNA clone AAC11 protein-like [Paramacrobiotus metropolitanus]XP_055337683.1 AAC-rich mRNA clone AAC11 protein-like [Paramacrobiotus metropolitanus]XP_055337684.1 AAC-rich mRNA clone AAC11 protein-like [Paramacrobiotus metropolitanus]XP_055337685.1 AAC-rich mRNA clone AAC11 protein-like [Paramacrobiotus metropolitanus]